jgi:hypothetical protein
VGDTVEARCLEIVLAEKRYGSSVALIDYLERMCAEAGLYPVFVEN